MNRNSEEMLRKFISNLKILKIRADFNKDSKAKEYKEMIEKLEQIRENRHLAMIGENNIEKDMYLQLLNIISIEDNEKTTYESIKQLLDNYELVTSKKEENRTDIGEER